MVVAASIADAFLMPASQYLIYKKIYVSAQYIYLYTQRNIGLELRYDKEKRHEPLASVL